VLAAVLAAAFNLRVGIVVVGPLIEDIRADTDMSSAVAGALTTIPFLCLGAFAFLGPPLVRRSGPRSVILGSLALIAAGSLLRAVAPNAPLIIAATLPIGLGIALIGVTLPAVVKERFPDRGGVITGAYIASLSVGIILVGAGVVPLSEGLGGWRGALAFTAAPAALAALLWLGVRDRPAAEPFDALRAEEARHGEAAALGAEPWMVRLRTHLSPDRTSLLLGLTCGLQSVAFAGMVSWGPAVYEEAGWSQGAAAIVVTSIGFYTIVASLTMLPASEGRDRRHWVSGTALAVSVASVGVALAPTDAAWLWLTLFGLGTGGVFPLLLALVLDLAEEPDRAVELTSWMLGLGYLIAGLTPVVTGALRDLTGDFVVPMLMLAGSGLLSAVLALLIPRPRPRPAAGTARAS